MIWIFQITFISLLLNLSLLFGIALFEILFSGAALDLVDSINGFCILVGDIHNLCGIYNLHALILYQIDKHVSLLVTDKSVTARISHLPPLNPLQQSQIFQILFGLYLALLCNLLWGWNRPLLLGFTNLISFNSLVHILSNITTNIIILSKLIKNTYRFTNNMYYQTKMRRNLKI